LSTLTKILIVLLTVSSIFLCGIVVTYVGSATNYKKEWQQRESNIRSLTLQKEDLEKEVNGLNQTISDNAITHSGRIDALTEEIKQLTTESDKYKIDLEVARTRIDDNASVLSDNLQTVATNNQLVKEAKARVAELETLKTTNEEKINDLTDRIMSQDAELEQSNAEIKRLTELNTQLQNQLDQNLRQVGKTAVMPAAVTQVPGPAQAVPPVTDLDLEGVVSEVKANDSLASISIGSANGVKQGMVFHVVRNDEYICDIVIFSADADQASGYFDLVNEDIPRAGDIVKTNF
jgi:cell division protein FtsL